MKHCCCSIPVHLYHGERACLPYLSRH